MGSFLFRGGGDSRGVMTHLLDSHIEVSRVQIPVSLSCLLSDEYPWEKHESLIPHLWVNCCSSIKMALTLDNLQRLICH